MRSLARICVVLLVLGTAAAASGRYEAAPEWPDAKGAPGYGTVGVSAVSIAPNGNVYVLQRGPKPVLVFDAQGRFVRSWGSGLFKFPHGCRVDPAGDVWITDKNEHLVMKFSPVGKLLLSLGVRGEAGADRRHFNQPADLAFAPDGSVYVADGYGNSRIVHFSRTGRYLAEWGKKGRGQGQFDLPHSIAIDKQGKVYVADRRNERIQVFDRAGRFLAQWPRIGKPLGLFITREQKLLIADEETQGVLIYSLSGKALDGWGGPGLFDLPHMICGDERGDIYVADVRGKQALRFTAAR